MRISTKMIVGYVLLVVLPFLLFAVFVYHQLYDKLLTQYQLANQQNLEQLGGSLDSSLAKIESLQSIYQNNAALIDYLRGEYTNDRDLIYSYLKEISPALSFAPLAEPSVTRLTIYPKMQERMTAVPGFQPYGKLSESLSSQQFSALKPAKGLWKRELSNGGLALSYYHKLYNDTYTTELGMVEIDVSPRLFGDFLSHLNKIHPDHSVLIVDAEGKPIEGFANGSFTHSQLTGILATLRKDAARSFLIDRSQLLVNTVAISRLDLTVIEINKRNELFTFLRTKTWWAAGGLLLLLLLSALYYLIVSLLTKRVVLLTRHMRKVGFDSLGNLYTGRTGTDEIGFLITTYNAMINRIDELVNRVQKVELLKKEADFKMLQAQIQPHFLYNTLETMRMLARANKDHQVAEMALSLGNLLRYSLSNSRDTTLREELDHVRAYIAIHQIRIPNLIFELEAEENVLTLHCPRFILQPLVENSMIHGFGRKRGDKRIEVRIRRESESAVRLTVSDNGTGISSDKLQALKRYVAGHATEGAVETRGMGIGLGNVAERVKAYFGPESGLEIDSRPGEGTHCSLLIRVKGDDHA
ncbi:HAMP domain-containing protein [Cohnella sp. CFH 77786]|uniref:sensor histidine kinase n=1 Tax=Cohnella sp. CFH 77786 TaxID=2662265 RepID=UPI001C60E791|nr:sensor histidine kinase [Cohnella sp. CFH 77786]MBW5446461.1 HAMP domain-containing protein [Cohnella sp. CFH 77786]